MHQMNNSQLFSIPLSAHGDSQQSRSTYSSLSFTSIIDLAKDKMDSQITIPNKFEDLPTLTEG